MNKIPVFVIGNSRSGTTMTARILGKSKEVFTFNELHYFEGFIDIERLEDLTNTKERYTAVSYLMKNGYDGYFKKKPSEATEKAIEEFVNTKLISEANIKFANIYLKTLSHIASEGESIFVDQTPKNIFFIKELRSSFSEAKFVVLVRDPRSILLSQKYKWKRRSLGASNIPLKEALRSWANYHPVTISKLWNANMNAAIREMEHSDVKILQYEHLVNEPELHVRELCEFLSVKFEPTMLDIPQIGSSIILDESGKTGIRTGNISAWKKNLTDTEIFLCERICASFMRQFNYELSGTRSRFYFISFITLPIKLGVSIVLNVNKVKSIYKSIRRRL